MVEIRGDGLWDCAIAVAGGMQAVFSIAAALAWVSPLGLPLGVIGLGIAAGSIINNPYVCDNIRG